MKYLFTFVISKISSTVAPLRSASYMIKWRSLDGVISLCSNSSLVRESKSLAWPSP